MEKMKAFEKFLLSKKEMNKLTGGSDIRTINGYTYLITTYDGQKVYHLLGCTA